MTFKMTFSPPAPDVLGTSPYEFSETSENRGPSNVSEITTCPGFSAPIQQTVVAPPPSWLEPDRGDE